MDYLLNCDVGILTKIHEIFSCNALDFLIPKITLLGDSGMIWIAIATVLICIKKYRKCGIVMLLALAAGVLIGNIILKPLIARPRPCWVDTSVTLLIDNPTDFSFPSGHTLSSFIAATVLVLHNKKFGLFAIPFACLIAFSRLYLFVHYPSDILGGMVIGILIGCIAFCLSNAVLGKWYNKRTL